MAVADVRPGFWIDENGALRKGAVPASDPGAPPAKPPTLIQTVDVVPGPPGTAVELRCICRKLLFRWKVDDQADSGALTVEIRCPRCRTTTQFRLPFRGTIDST